MMAAINQPDDAWKNAKLLTLFDNGNSRTNVYWWIATRGEPSTTDFGGGVATAVADEDEDGGGGGGGGGSGGGGGGGSGC